MSHAFFRCAGMDGVWIELICTTSHIVLCINNHLISLPPSHSSFKLEWDASSHQKSINVCTFFFHFCFFTCLLVTQCLTSPCFELQIIPQTKSAHMLTQQKRQYLFDGGINVHTMPIKKKQTCTVLILIIQNICSVSLQETKFYQNEA